MKKLLIVGLIFTLIVLSGCVEFPEEVSKDTSTKADTDVVAPTKQEAPKEDVKETIYSMNKDVNVDYLTYKVTKAETFTEMGTSMFNKETNGKFIKVYLEITNNAKETKQIFSPRFRIMDNQERQYDRLSDDMMYINDYLEFGKQLQPGLTASGAIVFELPKDSTELKLVIKGDWVSISEIKISFSLLFRSDGNGRARNQ